MINWACGVCPCAQFDMLQYGKETNKNEYINEDTH